MREGEGGGEGKLLVFDPECSDPKGVGPMWFSLAPPVLHAFAFYRARESRPRRSSGADPLSSIIPIAVVVSSRRPTTRVHSSPRTRLQSPASLAPHTSAAECISPPPPADLSPPSPRPASPTNTSALFVRFIRRRIRLQIQKTDTYTPPPSAHPSSERTSLPPAASLRTHYRSAPKPSPRYIPPPSPDTAS